MRLQGLAAQTDELQIDAISASMKHNNAPSKKSFLRVGFKQIAQDDVYDHLQLKLCNLQQPSGVLY